MASNTIVVLLVLALEGSYYGFVSQGSCTGWKEIVLCQNKECIPSVEDIEPPPTFDQERIFNLKETQGLQEIKFNLEAKKGLQERKFNLEAERGLQERKFNLEVKQGLQERKFNLEEKQGLQSLQARKFYLKEKRGLAILVTCNYQDTLPQTKRDAEKMNKMFEQFEYDVHSLINEEATLSNIEDLVKQVTKYLETYNGADENRDGSKKAIIFAFSGHGTHENQIKSNDWKLLRLHDIVKPLVNPKLAVAHPIPKLFFIDACRGIVKDNMIGAIEGNYCIEFATLQNHDAGALLRESEWMPVLADRLMSDDDTYQNVIAKVRSEVATEGQQPQAITNFTTGIFKLYHYTALKFNLEEKRGLAILVTCNYQGTLPQTERDAEEMKEMFEEFEYDVHPFINEKATMSNIKHLVKQVEKYLSTYNGASINHDGKKKVIIFAFSGHGVENQIRTNDGQLFNLHDIVKPLVNDTLNLVHPIPKLFFIDACRGSLRIEDDTSIEGNYCIAYAYATNEGQSETAPGAKTAWMHLLAEKFRRRVDTFQHVIAEVKAQVAAEGHQQCRLINNLSTGVFKLSSD